MDYKEVNEQEIKIADKIRKRQERVDKEQIEIRNLKKMLGDVQKKQRLRARKEKEDKLSSLGRLLERPLVTAWGETIYSLSNKELAERIISLLPQSDVGDNIEAEMEGGEA